MNLSEYVQQPVWSSVLLGPGAIGTASLFTIPIGFAVPRLGGVPTDLMPCATRLHTNLNKAGEMGSGIGDLLIQSTEYQVIGGNLDDLSKIGNFVRFTLRIGACEKFSLFLNQIPRREIPIIDIRRYDTIEGAVNVERELSLSQPVLLKIILNGLIRYDAR